MGLPAKSRIGPYEIVAALGAGGMGEVYRARDDRLGRDVAIKVLPEAVARDPDRLARLEREAKALAKLSHPAILSIFDFGKDGETAYAIMELLDGETLRERLGHERLSWRRAVEIAAALADGLASAHGAGVIHRDLKPENIFLTRDGRVKILDFGLARIEAAPTPSSGERTLSLTPDGTLPGTILGTVGYMAPEQVRGEPGDVRSDIFALGCVLYEMVTGQRTFERPTAAETMTAILREPVPEMALPSRQISSELNCIVGHCLEKNPAERFQSAQDMAFSLREVAKSDGGGLRAISDRRRHSLPTVLIPAALLVLAGAVFIWQKGGRREEKAAVASTEVERIAILPFENQGAGDDAYFASGVTEEIMERLSSVPGLAVVSRTSASQYARTGKSIRQIGSELGVRYLVTGTVHWAHGPGADEKVRIVPELVRIADDTSLWTKVYQFKMDDIFGIQSEIAQSVVERLGLSSLEDKTGSLSALSTRNMEAYQAFLRGRFLARQPHFTQATWLAAIGDFERAVSLDPGFAPAWAELTKGHSRLVYFNYDITAERREWARQALDRALELAPGSAEVRLAAGYYQLWLKRDPVAALAEFEAASHGLPNSVEVQSALGELFRLRGGWTRAIAAYQAASSLSPRDGSAMVDVAETLWWMRRYPEAVAAADRTIELEPNQPWGYLTKVFTLWSWKGGAGVAQARAALEFLPKDHEWAEWSWFWQEAGEGRTDEAVRRMEKDPEGWIRIKIQAAPKVLFAAVLRTSMGERDQARPGFEAARRTLEAEVRAAPDDARYHSSLGVAYAGLGRKKDAVREGERGVDLLPRSKDAVYWIPYAIDLALIYELIGDVEKSVEQLEILLSYPSWISVPWLRMDPRWRLLQGDPTFEALLAKYE
jgi:non-specific serine/threonine protein kinase